MTACVPSAANVNLPNPGSLRQPYVPHDTLPARPFCAGACPGTEQQRSGQIMSYQNRTG
jgi:hypothetical protein